jgi:hypothetical protein
MPEVPDRHADAELAALIETMRNGMLQSPEIYRRIDPTQPAFFNQLWSRSS